MSVLDKPAVHVVDSRQSYGAEKNILALDGPIDVNSQQFQPNSLNTSQITFNVNTPSEYAGTNKRVQYHLQFEVNLTGTPATGQTNLLDGVSIGLSDSVADQIISTERVTLGNVTNNVQRSQVGLELSRINKSTSYDRIADVGMRDFSTDFRPWLNTNRNVLAQTYDVNLSDQIANPRTNRLTITANGATTATVTADIYFYSRVSPFSDSNGDSPAIRKINNFISVLIFENDFMRLFSFAPLAGLAISIANNTMTSAYLEVEFITPSEDSLRFFTRSDDFYSYNQVQSWITPSTVLAASASATSRQTKMLTFPQISSNTIPSKIVIACRNVQSLLAQNGAQQPRFYYPIQSNGIRLTFNNRNVLQGLSQRQMYNMSVRNGLSNCTFDQFIGRDLTFDQSSGVYSDATNYVLGGCPLIIDPSLDLGITQEMLANDAQANWSLTGSIIVENQTYSQQTVELVLIAIYDGLMISDGNTSTVIGLLTREGVAGAFTSAKDPVVLHKAGGDDDLNGSSFFSTLGNLAKKVGSKLVDKAKAEAVKAISNPAAALSTAKKGFELISGNAMVGGRYLDTSAGAVRSKREMARKYY